MEQIFDDASARALRAGVLSESELDLVTDDLARLGVGSLAVEQQMREHALTWESRMAEEVASRADWTREEVITLVLGAMDQAGGHAVHRFAATNASVCHAWQDALNAWRARVTRVALQDSERGALAMLARHYPLLSELTVRGNLFSPSRMLVGASVHLVGLSKAGLNFRRGSIVTRPPGLVSGDSRLGVQLDPVWPSRTASPPMAARACNIVVAGGAPLVQDLESLVTQ